MADVTSRENAPITPCKGIQESERNLAYGSGNLGFGIRNTVKTRLTATSILLLFFLAA